MATLDDIAQELGVSKATVSKALNGAKDVSKKMQQAVVEKAVELGYSRINRSAVLPRIAVFVINMEYQNPDDFGYDIIVGFRQAAEPAGFQVEVIPLTQQLQTEYRYDAYMMQENFCGALFLGLCFRDPWLKECETCKTPTILYDNHVSCNPKVTEIGADNIESIELAVNYLRSLGHTRIGYLSSALEAYVYQQRYQAFIRVMTAMGLPADDTVMGNAYHVNVCLSQHLPRLLNNGCTAIICSHDMLAHSAMFYCSELGLRVPDDISIMGHDDIPLCRYTIPPLTTIRQNRPALGKSAFYALSCQLNGVPLSTHLLHAELILRSSCGPAPEKRKKIPLLDPNS
ncbi:MAG: LacI family DNA-binding transcriptional regulator [Oscillospiraceae bacterium]|nr:LacI family DNA-binding transcriptional regulator [Oscillospiraceae bacterium]